jgi:NAD(P)-dependent dehydrogenase (short-subunit alcohol dehydrogenase family)
MAALVDWVGQELGGADIVVNNAGIGMAGGIVDTSERDWQRILHVNVWGVIHGARPSCAPARPSFTSCGA